MNPLVVVDAHRRYVGPRLGDAVLEWDIVGVRHPARLLRIVHIGAREVAGGPALDLIAHVVLGRDDDSHGHQDDSGDVVAQSVHDVIVCVVP